MRFQKLVLQPAPVKVAAVWSWAVVRPLTPVVVSERAVDSLFQNEFDVDEQLCPQNAWRAVLAVTEPVANELVTWQSRPQKPPTVELHVTLPRA